MNSKVENQVQENEEIWFLGEGGESKESLSNLQEQVALLGKEVLESEFKKYLVKQIGDDADIENLEPSEQWNQHYAFHVELANQVKHLGPALIQKAIEAGLTLEIYDAPMENREVSEWYGGDVASVTKGNTTLLLAANGDIRCTYREILNGEVVENYVKDSHNSGNFYSELSSDIESDEKFYEYIQNNIDKKFPQLECTSNNWWEVFAVIDGEYHDMMCVLEAEKYTEALELLINDFDEYVDMVN